MVVVYALVLLMKDRDWRMLGRSVTVILIVAGVGMLWGGRDWLASVGDLTIGISLRRLLQPISDNPLPYVIASLVVAVVTLVAAFLPGERASTLPGLLMAASMLTAPYSNYLSFSSASWYWGFVPLVFARPIWGFPLYVLFVAPYLWFGDPEAYHVGIDNYVNVVLVLAWLGCSSTNGYRRWPASIPNHTRSWSAKR